MKIHREVDGSVVILERWTLLRAACLAGGLILPGVLVWVELTSDSISYLRLTGGAAGSILLLLIGAVVDQRRFVFDSTSRLLTWEQKNCFRTRGGRLEFSQIKDVTVTSTRSWEDGGSSVDYSTELITDAGRLRLSGATSVSRTESDHLAETVRSILVGPEPARTKEDDADSLIDAGNILDAVAMIREDEEASLTEARELAKTVKDHQIKTRQQP